jgi:hypothetical protein
VIDEPQSSGVHDDVHAAVHVHVPAIERTVQQRSDSVRDQQTLVRGYVHRALLRTAVGGEYTFDVYPVFMINADTTAAPYIPGYVIVVHGRLHATEGERPAGRTVTSDTLPFDVHESDVQTFVKGAVDMIVWSDS